MAIAKRRPARKSGASSRRAKVAGASTIKVKNASGTNSVFKKVSCHSTKSAAKSAAESIRQKGNRAVTRPGEAGKSCVFAGPKLSAKAKQMYTQTRRRKQA